MSVFLHAELGVGDRVMSIPFVSYHAFIKYAAELRIQAYFIVSSIHVLQMYRTSSA
jgi:hypothetical protein